MIESCDQEKICPTCKRHFYPQEKVVHQKFCGEDKLCSPPGDKYNAPDCEIYNFCSEECADKFKEQTPTCSYVPGWKRLMEKINKVSGSSGISGARPHQISRACR